MSEITNTKENIKVLRRLLKSEKYILRQQLAHKKNNMSESHKKKKVKKKTKTTSHKGSILAFKDCKCKYCKQPKAFGLSMTKALNAVMDEENKN